MAEESTPTVEDVSIADTTEEASAPPAPPTASEPSTESAIASLNVSPPVSPPDEEEQAPSEALPPAAGVTPPSPPEVKDEDLRVDEPRGNEDAPEGAGQVDEAEQPRDRPDESGESEQPDAASLPAQHSQQRQTVVHPDGRKESITIRVINPRTESKYAKK